MTNRPTQTAETTSPYERIWTSALARELHELHPELCLWHGKRVSPAPSIVGSLRKGVQWDTRPECWTLCELGNHPKDNSFRWVEMQGPLTPPEDGDSIGSAIVGAVLFLVFAPALGWAVAHAFEGAL